jgi:hypothetical protein
MQVAFCSLFKLFGPILQLCSDTPWLGCRCDADAKVFTDMPKCYTVITLHHLFHFGMCIWVCNVRWMIGVCQVLSASPTLFEPLAPVKHCCMPQTVVTVHMLHLRMNVRWSCNFRAQSGWCSTVHAWTNPWLSSTEHQAVLQRGHTEKPAYDVCLSWSALTTVGWHKND